MDGALIVLDGWGLGAGANGAGSGAQSGGESGAQSGDDGGRDAVAAAHTPTMDRICREGAFATLDVSGRRVGLPDGQMGNSEVGHLTIGAGRVVPQAYTRITDAVEDGSIRDNEAIETAFEYVRDRDGRVHFLGLVSDGGVHSDQGHLHALVRLAADRGIEAVTHAFTDGRDTDPTGGKRYLSTLESVIEDAGTGRVATVSGRYYAMDRDGNWDRTKRAYDAIVHRETEFVAESAVEAVTDSYERGETDEFVEPTAIVSGDIEGDAGRPALSEGDAVIWMNFRADRARQLTRLLGDIRPEWPFETEPPPVEIVTMTEYDETFDLPVAFPSVQPGHVLGEVLAESEKTQLRIAESEKYPHVTYFLNGGREVEFDGERREIVPSPDVATYDLRPEMSAEEVTDVAISTIEADDPNVLVLNYANPDMVGHTGDYRAAVEAVEAVDHELGRLLETLRERGAHVLVTADHGNADDMGTPEDPHTAHTRNDVPLISLAPDGTDGGRRIRADGSLADVAPTLLSVVGIDAPSAMTGESLLR